MGDSPIYAFPGPCGIMRGSLASLELMNKETRIVDISLNANVEATDGHVGNVGELVTDPDSGQVTHLVLQEGHGLGKREVTLPLSAVERVKGDTVYLKLDKEAVKQLPSLPVQRRSGKADTTQIELLARIFDDPDKASRAMESLDDWNRLYALKVRSAAVLVKDETGETSVEATRDMGPGKGGLIGGFTGALFGLLGGPVGMVIGAAVGAGAGGLVGARLGTGFSTEFLERFQEHLQPGTSAFVVIVERESVQRLSDAMAHLEGVVLQETLTDEMVKEILAESEAQD